MRNSHVGRDVNGNGMATVPQEFDKRTKAMTKYFTLHLARYFRSCKIPYLILAPRASPSEDIQRHFSHAHKTAREYRGQRMLIHFEARRERYVRPSM